MRYLSFLVLKLRYLKFFGLLAICLGVGLFSASNANAQRVTFGVGFGGPVYYGPPDCAYGYYGYYPYSCAPYGYYGPEWFDGSVFLGAGPWWGFGFRDRDRFFDRGFHGGGFHGGGFRGEGFHGGGFRGQGFHGGNGFRGGGGFHGGGGSGGG